MIKSNVGTEAQFTYREPLDVMLEIRNGEWFVFTVIILE